MLKKFLNKVLIKYYTFKLNSFRKKRNDYCKRHLLSYDFDISHLAKYQKKITFYKEKIEKLRF